MAHFPKLIVYISICGAIAGATGNAQNGPPTGGMPKLTDKQRTCLQGQIGPISSGTRPTRAQIDAAFQACGMQRPQMPAQMQNGANTSQDSGSDSGSASAQ